MDAESYRDLYRHMAWADAVAWSAVLACDAARGDARLRDVLYHTHLVQHAFLRTWRAEPVDAAFPTFTDLAGVQEWGRAFHQQALPHLQTVSDARLSEPMPVAWASQVERLIGRPPATTTLGDTVLQVALHTMHHRAQVNMRLRDLAATPPLVDYIMWVWLGRPSPEWPAGIP